MALSILRGLRQLQHVGIAAPALTRLLPQLWSLGAQKAATTGLQHVPLQSPARWHSSGAENPKRKAVSCIAANPKPTPPSAVPDRPRWHSNSQPHLCCAQLANQLLYRSRQRGFLELDLLVVGAGHVGGWALLPGSGCVDGSTAGCTGAAVTRQCVPALPLPGQCALWELRWLAQQPRRARCPESTPPTSGVRAGDVGGAAHSLHDHRAAAAAGGGSGPGKAADIVGFKQASFDLGRRTVGSVGLHSQRL